MKITIHRGSREIGGTCVELSAGRTTCLVDLGRPLSGNSADPDLTSIRPDAVLISHPHQDHFGLIEELDSSVPVYMGRLGRCLADAPRIFRGLERFHNNFKHFSPWQRFTIGDFIITPYLIDHSAVDAYAFLIEAEGTRVLYSGDFRENGHKKKLFTDLLKSPPRRVELLLLEGTMMRRDNGPFPSEQSVQEKIYDTIKNQKNVSFLICSSQNIDRLVSAHHACNDAGKTFVIDIYTAWVLEQVKAISGRTPALGRDNIKVYADYWSYQVLRDNHQILGEFTKKVFANRVTKEKMLSDPGRYLYLKKLSGADIIDLYKKTAPVTVIYSQWLGHLDRVDEEPAAARFARCLNDKAVQFVYAHTSGHAPLETLKKLAAAVMPNRLAPLHTEYPEDFRKHFNNVVFLRDGETLTI